MTVSYPKAASKGDATCDFTKHQDAVFRELRIEVRAITGPKDELARRTAHCNTKPMALKGVGNEALACNVDHQKGRLTEQVVARVRDRIFVVQLRADAAWVPPDVLLAKACTLAEEVAGNLF